MLGKFRKIGQTRLAIERLCKRVEGVGVVLIEFNSENVCWSGGLWERVGEVGIVWFEFNSENVVWSGTSPLVLTSPTYNVSYVEHSLTLKKINIPHLPHT